MTACQVINHTPAGYALRQIDANPTALRIGDLIALRVEGRTGLQVAMVRWFRNTLKASGLEFGCELLSDSPEAAAAAAEDAAGRQPRPGRRAARGSRTRRAPKPSPPQLLVPAGRFQVEQGISLKRGNDTGLCRAAEARRAGPGLRALRLRAGRLNRWRQRMCRRATPSHRRQRIAAALIGALVLLLVLWETVLAPLRARRLVARAEGAPARARVARRCARHEPRAADRVAAACRSMLPRRSCAP